MKKVYLIALGAAAILLTIALILALLGRGSQTDWLVVSGLLCLALVVRSFPAYASLSFTVLIVVAVAVATYHPEYLLTWGDFELKRLIVPLMQVIMFGMGTIMTTDDFVGVIKMPRGIIVGLLAHYVIMPGVGFALANVFNFPAEIAAGVVLIGCVPSGLASNVICYISRANVALSVSVTTVSTLLAPILTPSLMKLLAGQFVPVHFWDMMVEILKVVIIPIIIGVVLNTLFGAFMKRVKTLLPLVSMAAIICVVAVITATGRDKLLTMGVLLIISSLIHNLSGYLLGYWTGRLAGLDESSSRTVAIEVGMQNGGLASALALQMGKVGTTGLAPAIFGPLMNTTGSILDNYWRRRPPSGVGDADLKPEKKANAT
ncbi:bile acid:sodium symporter family protein [Tellurirhabdus bombi]|uniref:bile acid:sodium symporter family protein n=1 Tax=Tellurirhabdus bombi TaxID=2907205 RepID=UPI001F250250|nr:bile acid:sodium symporter family protein [Tellurirhabdus bombi]